tara:strand:- start:2957 stop:3673 length:717 start_codon:yes stop_codon:yes gene_type:complete
LGKINFLKKKIIAIIPARSGSKSVKNKNIKNLLGKPLLAWSIKSCLKSKKINKVFVSTDSKKYAKIALKNGANGIIIRPNKISKDKSTDYQWVNHAILKLKKLNYDFIAHIRPTTPLRSTRDLDRAITAFSKSNYHSLRSIHEMPETAYKSFEKKGNYLKPLKNIKANLDQLNNSRQSFSKTYVANGVIDIYRKNFILKNKKLFGKKVMAYLTKYTPEIDSVDEFKYIEYLAKKHDQN